MWCVVYSVVRLCQLFNCFVVHGCAISRRYLQVCNIDMFSIVNMYHDHLKFCVVCINGRRYVCCGERYVVPNEIDEPTP